MIKKQFEMLLLCLEQEVLKYPFKRGMNKSTVLEDYYKLVKEKE